MVWAKNWVIDEKAVRIISNEGEDWVISKVLDGGNKRLQLDWKIGNS